MASSSYLVWTTSAVLQHGAVYTRWLTSTEFVRFEEDEVEVHRFVTTNSPTVLESLLSTDRGVLRYRQEEV